MWYQAGADVVVVIHLLFIGFVVGGVFLAWRWPRIIWAHIPAVVYGALVEFAGFTCPLTLLENDLRRHAGEAGYGGGFIDHYLVKVIYPPGLTRGMQVGLGLLVLLVAVIGYRGFARRHPLPHRYAGAVADTVVDTRHDTPCVNLMPQVLVRRVASGLWRRRVCPGRRVCR